MSIRLKFDGGKRVNRCSRGSWHSRCYGAFLRSSRGAKWSPGVWKKQTRSKPSAAFIRFYNRYAHHQQCAKISRKKPEVKSCSVKRKHESRKVVTSIKARKSYGPEAEKIDCNVSHGFSSKFRLVNPQIFQRGCQRLYFSVLNYYKRSLGVCLWHYIKSTLLPKLHTKDIICKNYLLTYKLLSY